MHLLPMLQVCEVVAPLHRTRSSWRTAYSLRVARPVFRKLASLRCRSVRRGPIRSHSQGTWHVDANRALKDAHGALAMKEQAESRLRGAATRDAKQKFGA